VIILIKKILVAIDGSETTNRILDFTFDLALKYSAKIFIISVMDVVSLSLVAQGIMYTPVATTQYLEDLEKFHKKVLNQATMKAKEYSNKLKFSKKLLKGRAAEKIVEEAFEGNFDLIVIGSRGLGGVKEFFLGSVSDRVADHSKCPVLIVK
jgi:nucleotide-binding universal stress UspA family protein